jgi:hypothetical protein
LTDNNDKILEFTPEWIHNNDLFRKLDCNKAKFTKEIKNLLDQDYLQFKQVGNRHYYKRDDSGDNEIGFMGIMKLFEDNQKTELDEIERLTTIGYGIYNVNESGYGQWENTLTNEGKELLDHIQSEVDRAYIVMVRMNYQSKLRVITQRIADERTKRLQQHIDKIMTALTSKYDNKLIKEYFQNHLKRLEFKI